MALILETSVRTDIITRRRYTLDKRIANRLSAVLWANDGRTHRRDNPPGERIRSPTKRVAGGSRHAAALKLPLLRPCREQPRGCAADKCDELAPSHP